MQQKPDFKKCEKLAGDILNKYAITEPFVNVFDIVRNEGLELRFIDMPEKLCDVAGFLDPEEKVIFVNKDDPSNRQTFTIAHELAHHLLDHQKGDYNVLLRWTKFTNGYPPIEQEANSFAANLLVPKKMLKEIMREYSLTGRDDLDLSILAKIFAVSKEMMAYRLKSI